MNLTVIFILLGVMFFLIRYDLDFRIAAWIGSLIKSSNADEEVPTIEEIYPIRDKSYYDKYDSRLEQIKEEIEAYNNSDNNADELMGVKNLPHETINMIPEVEPAVEEEEEIGIQEIAR